MGGHERDRQLPRPALALALHLVVPGPRVRQFRQRRLDRRLPNRGGDDLAASRSIYSRPAGHTPPGPRPSVDLAPVVRKGKAGPVSNALSVPAEPPSRGPQKRYSSTNRTNVSGMTP